MPYKYVLELCCDFIGAGKAYNNVSKDTGEPLKYWINKVDKTFVHKDTIKLIEKHLTNYKNH